MFLRQTEIIGRIALVLAGVFNGTPWGRNSIPTAYTTAQGVLALQAIGAGGGEANDDFKLGFTTGLDLGLFDMELGADSHISPDDAGPVTVQAKPAYALGDNPRALAIRSADTTFSGANVNRTGKVVDHIVFETWANPPGNRVDTSLL